MAEEQIKIRIQADAADFKTIMDAVNAKLAEFGKTATIVSGNVKIVQKDLDNTANSFKKLGDAAASSSEKMKSSNQVYTHFALVLQDLPYGFRGIQNNLPALIGDFAGLAGPIYLAGSAIIAFFTAYDMGLFKVKNATSILDDAKKNYEETLKKSNGAAQEEIVKIQALVSISSDHEISMGKRLKAVKELQDQYPSYFGNLTKEKILNGDVTIAVDGVKDAIIARAEATAAVSKINELASQKFVLNEQLYQLALQKTAKLQEVDIFMKKMAGAGFTETAKHQKGLIDAQIDGIRSQENAIHVSVGAIDKELTRLANIYKTKKADSLELDSSGPKPKEQKTNKTTLDLLKAQYDYYKENIFMAKYYGGLYLDEKKRVAVEEAKIKGYSKTQILDIEKTADLEYQTLVQGIEAKRFSYQEESIRRQKKLTDDYNKEKVKGYVDAAKDISDTIKTQLATELKLHKGNQELQRKDIQDAINKTKLALALAFDPQAADILGKRLKDLQAQMAGFGTTGKQMADIVQNSLISAFDSLGESIGKGLASGTFDFTAIATVMADALQSLGKALVAYAVLEGAAIEAFADPLSWPIALAAGIGAIAAGAFLKAKMSEQKTNKFANGGIVSGPTMGLMGEYPGAKSNPEVIAPLDKLKSMIGGGGGGMFVLRGQDLLLSINRAQKASNLKGQNISLA
jgi:hypothetical protein